MVQRHVFVSRLGSSSKITISAEVGYVKAELPQFACLSNDCESKSHKPGPPLDYQKEEIISGPLATKVPDQAEGWG